MGDDNPDLLAAETGISSCPKYNECNSISETPINLSSINPGDQRRGSRNPRVLLLTEAPDKKSKNGTAYEGSLSQRIQRIFCDEDYGIALSNCGHERFSEFLCDNDFYATSAVKCHFEGRATDLSNRVVYNCFNQFLSKQLRAMSELELIIPMGQVAASAVTKQSLDSIEVTKIVGRQNQGIITQESEFARKIIVIPHPSGNNPYSNAPILSQNDDYIDYKLRYRNGLASIRETLSQLGYDVMDEDPDAWETPDNLSNYTSSQD